MKLLRIIGAIICAIGAISMLVCLEQTLTGQTTVNPKVIESTVDKIFWTLAIAGCSGVYVTGVISLLKGVVPTKDRVSTVLGCVSMFAFMAGLYYTVIFGSPW